uniref:Uncharacterized protein n=1 Tax=Nitratidesulfovibrio vulgaris (strain DSM 19637 / Miyazaki F) TaxID=883 RepID=B8DRX5_NITV9
MRIRWQYSIPLILLFVPFIWAMGFTFPVGDDFARSNEARFWFDIPQALESMGRSWWTWSGRYTHHFLVIFLGKSAESRFGYALVCSAACLLYWGALWNIFSELSHSKRKAEAFFIASVCMLALYSCYPTLGISFYEVTDILGITFGNGLVLLFVGRVCALWNAERVRSQDVWISSMPGILAVGCYEHSAVATIAVSVCVYVLAARVGHKHKSVFLKIVVVMAGFFLLSFLARGNFRRQTKRAVSWAQMLEQLLPVFSMTFELLIKFLSSFFAVVCVWLGTVAGGCSDVSAQNGTKVRGFSPAYVLSGCLLMAFLVTLGIVTVHALSDVPISSTGKLSASVLLLISCVAVAMCVHVLRPVRCFVVQWMDRGVYILVSAFVIVMVLLMQPAYGDTVYSIFSGETTAYAASKEKRNAYLRWKGFDAERGVQAVSRELLAPYPNAVWFAIPGSPEEWPASKVAQMFGVDAVAAMLPDPAVALRVAADRGRLGGLVPIGDGPGGCAAVVERDIVAGPNDTFRFHWLLADVAGCEPGNVVTVVLLHRQSARPLPVALQRRYERQLLDRERVPVDEMPLFAGIRHSWNFREWTADTGSGPWLAIPVAAPEWGEVKAVFVSVNGSDFRRVPL